MANSFFNVQLDQAATGDSMGGRQGELILEDKIRVLRTKKQHMDDILNQLNDFQVQNLQQNGEEFF